MTEDEKLINALETAFPANAEIAAKWAAVGDGAFPEDFTEAYQRGRHLLGAVASGNLSDVATLSYDAWYVAGFALSQTVGQPGAAPVVAAAAPGQADFAWGEFAFLLIKFLMSLKK